MNAPILVTVYDRDKHFRKTIESLLDCYGSDKSDLFIALDGAASDYAHERQKLIKKYVCSIKGFNSIEFIVRDKNYGATKNSRLARDEVFSIYNKMIRTEDDNIFSPHFISYMNKGLDIYESDENIFSVCGYLEPINLDIDSDIFLRQGFTSNGFGVWKKKYEEMELSQLTIKDEDLSFFNFQKMIRSMGYHVVSGLIYSERIQYPLMDYYICYYLYKNSMKCIFPKETLVRNIGQDGSGMHSGINIKLQNQSIHLGEIIFNDNVLVNSSVDETILNYHKRSFLNTVYQYYKFINIKR